MQLKQRIKRMEKQIIGSGFEFCPETCRPHPEIITSHAFDGVPVPVPSWFGKGHGNELPEKQIVEICERCDKPTRQLTVIIDWVTSF